MLKKLVTNCQIIILLENNFIYLTFFIIHLLSPETDATSASSIINFAKVALFARGLYM